MQTRSLSSLSWPTAAVLCTALVVIAATMLAGPSLGLESETLRYLLSAEAGLGLLVTAIMRGLFSSAASVLALVVLSAATMTSACSSGAAAAPAVITARDLTCTGGRVVCRVLDRTCRATGGPWVVPQSAAELEQASNSSASSGGESSIADPPVELDVIPAIPRPHLEIVDGRFLASGVGLTSDGNPRVLGRPGDTSDAEEARVVAEWQQLWRERARR